MPATTAPDPYNQRGAGCQRAATPITEPAPEPDLYQTQLASWRTLTGATAVLFAMSITDGEVTEYLIVLDGDIEILTASIFDARDAVTRAGY